MHAGEVAAAIAAGFQLASPLFETIVLPIADGGDHFMETLSGTLGGEIIATKVLDAQNNPVESAFAILPGNIGVVEMARASGLAILGSKPLDARAAHSYGTGQLIAAALDKGCTQILLGVGGSATTDAGTAAMEALGVVWLDAQDTPLRIRGGKDLHRIAGADLSQLHPGLATARLTIACDVDNPFYGPQGAAFVFSPQKGATAEEVVLLDQGLKSFAHVAQKVTGTDLSTMPGSGAAGGIAGGFCAFLGASLQGGFELVAELLGLQKHLAECDLVITGEGKLDSQTLGGKGPYGIAMEARKLGKPVIAMAGMLPAENWEDFQAFDAMFALADRPMALPEAMQRAPELVKKLAFQVARCVLAAKKIQA